MLSHEIYMARCLELAQNGIGFVAPNPMVGCVIVHKDRIIGEGYHQIFGCPHAEVNAISSVPDQELLKHATLFVNLEPCAHWGKTPPCSDLIIEKGIPHVVIGCQDIFAEVNGKGIQKLRAAGVRVETGILEKESLDLNKRFFTFHSKKRPYIILKWAQTVDGFIARKDNSSKWISNPYSRLLVHKWRGEEAGIMVGTNTALYDNPQLNAREMGGKNPVRIVLDKSGKLPHTHHIFDGSQKTIIVTETAGAHVTGLEYFETDFGSPDFLENVLKYLYQQNIQSIFVEGGSALFHSFMAKNLWDEARVFKAGNVFFGEGIGAPVLDIEPLNEFEINEDELTYYLKN